MCMIERAIQIRAAKRIKQSYQLANITMRILFQMSQYDVSQECGKQKIILPNQLRVDNKKNPKNRRQKMPQNLHTLHPTKQLHQLYPDIEDELCSRHSNLFGKLRQTFNKLYDNMQPTNYVIVKGNCQLVEQSLTEIQLSMALENGTVTLVAKTYRLSEIFINSNHFSEEVIFSHNGDLLEGLHYMSDQMSAVIKCATQNLSPQSLNGAILYIHGNIPENEFNYKQSFYINLYLSIMSVNDNLQNLTIDQMIADLSTLGFVGEKQEIEMFFKGYKNSQLNLSLPDLISMRVKLGQIDIEEQMNENFSMIKQQKQNKSSKSIQTQKQSIQKSRTVQKSQLMLDMPKQYKFLFCKLDLARDDIDYETRRRHQIEERKRQLLQEMKQKHRVNGLFELFHKINTQIKLQQVEFQSKYTKSYQPKSMEELQLLQEDDILAQPTNFLQALLSQTQLVSDFSNDKLNLESLVDALWQVNSQHLKLHSSQVVELVEDMKEMLEIKGCMIVNRNFLLVVVHKNQFTELICQVKHKMNRGELKSKSLFRIEDQELIEQRWSADQVIGEKIFSSLPAQGVGVYDPTGAIWFD